MTRFEKSTVSWAIIALFFSIFVLAFHHPAPVITGFGHQAEICATGAFLGWVGAMVGGAVRYLTLSDIFFEASDAEDASTLDQVCGTALQVIGLVAGSIVGVSLMLG